MALEWVQIQSKSSCQSHTEDQSPPLTLELNEAVAEQNKQIGTEREREREGKRERDTFGEALRAGVGIRGGLQSKIC